MLKLHPSWRQAVKEIVDTGLAPGRVLTSAELRKSLGIAEPFTADDFKDAQLAFVRGMTRVKEELLEEHCVDLETLPGVGYRITEPKLQTKLALRDGAKAIAKAMHSTDRRLSYVNKTALTMDERRENDDALVKLSRLKGLIGRPARFLSASSPS